MSGPWSGGTKIRLSGAMEYLVAFQLLCGCFAGYVASRKERNWFAWFLIGALVPVFGVIAALLVDEPATESPEDDWTEKLEETKKRKLKPPKRCCARYIPDCQGCPYFRKPLFDPTYSGSKKGYCELFEKDLIDSQEDKGAKITIEEE
jgi:hypothetical protein